MDDEATTTVHQGRVPHLWDIDLSSLYFTELQRKTLSNGSMQETVDIFTNATDRKRLRVQLCPDVDAPMRTLFSLDAQKPNLKPDENDRRGLAVKVEDPRLLQSISGLDAFVAGYAKEQWKAGWKRSSDVANVDAFYHKLIKEDKYGKPFVKMKIKCTPGKVPTDLHLRIHGEPFRKHGGRLEMLETRGADVEIVPIVSILSIWFMGSNSFGLNVQAEEMIITRPLDVERPLLDNFTCRGELPEVVTESSPPPPALPVAADEDE